MAVHILGGKARGFPLDTPPENITRPTAVLLRRRLFDWRQHWEGWHFVDLCAGSGAMGFEALSRGAAGVVLNEAHKTAYRVLERNRGKWDERFSEGPLARLRQGPFQALLGRLAEVVPREAWPQTVLFFDPPYEEHALYEEFWRLVQDFPGEVWLESDRLKGPALEAQRQHLSGPVKEVWQGDHWILVGRTRVDGGEAEG